MYATPDFLYCPFEVLKTPGLTDGERLLLIVIHTLSSEKGYCWAKVQTLAQLTGTNPRQVQRRKSVLEKASLIRVERKAGQVDRIFPVPLVTESDTHDRMCHPCQNVSPLTESDGGGVSECVTPPPTKSVTQPMTECVTYTTKTNIKTNIKTNGDQASNQEHQKRHQQQEEQFTRFWAAYPKKVGKQAARKAWDKLKPDEALIAQMLKALEWQRGTQSWQKDNGQYIPHPSTWLNNRRWEDEPPSQPQTGGNLTEERVRKEVYDENGNFRGWK